MADDPTVQTGIFLPSKLYDALKFTSLIVLPGASALYAALAGLWNLMYPVEVVGTMTAVSAFIGLIVRSSSKSYAKLPTQYDGVLNVTQEGDRVVHQIDITKEPEQIKDQDQFVLKVNNATLPTPPRS